MLKKIVRSLGESADPIEALQREIAALEQRAASIERSLSESRDQHEAAISKRRDLLEAPAIDFDGADLVEVNERLRLTETRMADLADALSAAQRRRSAASARLAEARDQEARGIETARVDQMLEAAIKAKRGLDSALAAFVAAYQPLTMSGEMAATSATAFHERVGTFAADAVTATREYREQIANGSRALPAAAMVALQKPAAQDRRSKEST
ncbi:MAG: hypothetical protein JHD07_08895 [Bradyrhizobium sp.]|uniref:hypothetical protein n=1 Tax=Bradyrhizobium sp. TaxID=376 RepID=UPI001A2AEFD5|nr:hypothetical protein [Bradyrhizobium sp.]MBJ7403395.1 hypothetical protein [Bradyrhizobium sp.]